MTSFYIRLYNRDGSVDRHEIGSPPDAAAALRRARDFLLVSLSAVRVELYAAETMLGRLDRSEAANSFSRAA